MEKIKKYHFRLAGVPPEKAIKPIAIDPNCTFGTIKKLLR